MKAKHLFTLTALAVAACAAFADEAPHAPLTRAEVVQSVLQARAAGTLQPNGEGPAVSEYPRAGAPASSLTRSEVVAEVVQARASGTLQPIGQGSVDSEFPQLSIAGSALTRAQVQEQVIQARANGELLPAGQADLSMEHGLPPTRTAALSSARLLAWIHPLSNTNETSTLASAPPLIGAGR